MSGRNRLMLLNVLGGAAGVRSREAESDGGRVRPNSEVALEYTLTHYTL
jgi:hypothetical protein